MSELWGHFIGVWILLMMLAFIGIWVWAWSGHHTDTFDALARVPMKDTGEAP